jgi:uncharacterized Fe-S cluster-containing radical SAM superfamily protein
MYDPIELSKTVKRIVTASNRKKYYRFRPTGFYGGISTADTVGCNLRCVFCWSSNSVWNAKQTGSFYTSEDVARKLESIAYKKGYSQLRVSGGEPTIGKDHLLQVLTQINSRFLFILETNGLLIGYDKSYAKKLSCFPNLHVRVCLKGCTKEEFSLLTGAEEKGFEYQLQSLTNLKNEKVRFSIAVASPKKDKQALYQRLQSLGFGTVMIEEEPLKLYPHVKKRLQKQGLLDLFRD